MSPRAVDEAFSRTALLIGTEGVERLGSCKVAVFGLGGVGSWAAEALARAGVGSFVLVDFDVVCESNINRQAHALRSTLGLAKTDAMRDRILDINPRASVETHAEAYSPELGDRILVPGLSYAIDAMDTMSAKIDLALRAAAAGVPLVSSMGAGKKLDPTRFEVADISETSVCPLARAMRAELRKRGLGRLKVVYSREKPIESRPALVPAEGAAGAGPRPRRAAIGSISFVPPVAGLILAAEVVKDLLDRS
jgi:tRNA A37 threonylcarbamoyladenosine dehydratase